MCPILQAVLGGDLLARDAMADAAEERDDLESASAWRAAARGGVERVDSLPRQIEAILPTVRDYWLSMGLRTCQPGDRVDAEAAIARVYREGGLAPPANVVWMRGPLHGAVAAAILAQVGAQVVAQVGAQVRDQVRDQVWAQVGAQVRAQVRDQVGAQVWKCGYGSHDAAWLSFYHTLDLAGLACVHRLRPLMDLAHCCGWWWPFEGTVILTDAPERLVMRGGKLVECVYGDGLVVKGE